MQINNLKPGSIRLDYVGCTTNLQIFPQGSSGARVAMQGTHYPQTVQCVGAELRKIFAGPERDYANYMFNVVVEHTCRVLRTIERVERPGLRTPMETTVFVELINPDGGRSEIDIIIIPKYMSNHQTFGYNLELTDIGRKLKPGMVLKKGTVLAETPSVIEGEWSVGVHANAILVSHPMVIEDSCLISRSFAEKMLTYGYKTFTMDVGKKEYPLMIYGEGDDRRMFPKVGEKIRDDGILFAKRPYDPLLAAVEMSVGAISTPCGHYDICTFVDPESVVVDIKIHRDDTKPRERDAEGRRLPSSKMATPAGMQEICDEYAEALSKYQEEIRLFYNEQRKELGRRGRQVPLTPRARQAVRMAIADKPDAVIPGEPRRVKQFNYDMIDNYRIEITVKYPIPLAMSGKITDTMGGKGIVCMVVDDEDMPVDDYGNRVDIMMSENAMLRRTNFNRGFEHYVNAARRDVQKRTMEMYESDGPEVAWEYLIGFLNAVNPIWANAVAHTHQTIDKIVEFIEDLREEDLRLWVPSSNPIPMDEVMRNIKRDYPPVRSPLTFRGPSGEMIRTKESFIVGELYMIRLDKTGREFSAVSAGKFQSFGTIAKRHSADKNRRPVSENPIKFMGESEARHLEAYVGDNVCAEIHSRANNPVEAGEIVRNILMAEVPMNLDVVIDRGKFPLGHNRSMEILRHIMACDGQKFTTRRQATNYLMDQEETR
jgi:hypothetical protein